MAYIVTSDPDLGQRDRSCFACLVRVPSARKCIGNLCRASPDAWRNPDALSL
jgi:hypothetical protein